MRQFSPRNIKRNYFSQFTHLHEINVILGYTLLMEKGTGRRDILQSLKEFENVGKIVQMHWLYGPVEVQRVFSVSIHVIEEKVQRLSYYTQSKIVKCDLWFIYPIECLLRLSCSWSRENPTLAFIFYSWICDVWPRDKLNLTSRHSQQTPLLL